MSYYFATTLHIPFEEAAERTRAALADEGFGILTDIDVAETFDRKLGVDFPPYRILGACNPALAREALLRENKIGTMLPCNVVVRQQVPGAVEVAAVDPVASMRAVENPALAQIASAVQVKLRHVIERLTEAERPADQPALTSAPSS